MLIALFVIVGPWCFYIKLTNSNNINARSQRELSDWTLIGCVWVYNFGDTSVWLKRKVIPNCTSLRSFSLVRNWFCKCLPNPTWPLCSHLWVEKASLSRSVRHVSNFFIRNRYYLKILGYYESLSFHLTLEIENYRLWKCLLYWFRHPLQILFLWIYKDFTVFLEELTKNAPTFNSDALFAKLSMVLLLLRVIKRTDLPECACWPVLCISFFSLEIIWVVIGSLILFLLALFASVSAE